MASPRIASLDALRGLAALTVAIHHYHFLAPAATHPFHNAIAWFYDYGRLAVPFFYMLSGYVFFAAYARLLGEGALSGRDFFWLRVARLYPLHLLTLFAVIGLQGLATQATGKCFVYCHNDFRHFVFNLAFLQFGWFDPIMSFNGPSWSLSVEAGLYVAFFAAARAFGAAIRPRLTLGAACLALGCVRQVLPWSGPLTPYVAEGLGCFFIGGCLQATQDWADRRKLALGAALLALGVGLLYGTDGLRETAAFVFAGLVLLALGSADFRRAALSLPLVWLGQISYSLYLWHFPVQIAMVTHSAAILSLDFYSPLTLIIYVALTLAIASLSYCYFEVPARRLVRRWAVRPAPTPAPA